MEVFLSKVTGQAMNFAIRSGISITATYAINQSSRLLKNVSGADRAELLALQERLQSKIRVISPAIDMIELIAARGNTSLESAVSLTKALRYDIQSLASRLEKAATAEELARKGAISSAARSMNEAEIKLIIREIKRILNRIEDAVPLMNLAITTSGASLSTTLPSTISPSRLLQASTFLTACDTQYSMTPATAVQVGPTFTLSVYMLFSGHIRPHDEESVRETTWKEVMHKARVKIRRVPLDVFIDTSDSQTRRSHLPATARADEFAYQILIVEDLDDDRVHSFDDGAVRPGPYEGIHLAGIREIIPIHQISKIFYADTGKVLNIGSEGETNNPVLLLKRDINAIPPRRMVERDETYYTDPELPIHKDEEQDELQSQLDAQLNNGADNATEQGYCESLSDRQIPDAWKLPPGLDPEWVAFEVYHEEQEDDDEDETEAEDEADTNTTINPKRMANLTINDKEKPPSSPSQSQQVSFSSVQEISTSTTFNPLFNNIRTSLSLLETLLRLTSLQQFQQQSHLSITDELLNFFLEESSSTGAGGDEYHRQRLRAEARRKVGWDPYDESPLKRRGEDYQYQYTDEGHWTPTGTPARYGYRESSVDPVSPNEPNQIRSSRYQTPESSPGLPRQSARPPLLAGERKVVSFKGSPLSKRPTTANTDEGLGTSPGTGGESRGQSAS
ncbi:RanGTP-binding protein-domain-containing protein [Talaromyces proteolyticus]|uniref:RanGTP-binding protein-domain-containing protein n=1 Tax=Talaromyces proteolyticus TaxID=1131652 RepID=A0AAD4KDU3_9EURO|nr:RanGTP-binding protein-domain-containing protein [Talaromyces proteolyticus]KAH8689467.1 RanGTP-binding protein-domain-containing protein [Talaromyces proteolyticus]